MSNATIVLEDAPAEDGQPASVACKLVFSGGFDKTSPAHQHAQILIGLMDQWMVRQGAAVIDPLVVEAKPELQTSGADVVASLGALKRAAELQRG